LGIFMIFGHSTTKSASLTEQIIIKKVKRYWQVRNLRYLPNMRDTGVDVNLVQHSGNKTDSVGS